MTLTTPWSDVALPTSGRRPLPKIVGATIIAAIACIPFQVEVAGSSVRVAPADFLFAASALLLFSIGRAPRRRLAATWLALLVAVTWAVVIGSWFGDLWDAALVDRWLGSVVLLLVAFTTSELDHSSLSSALDLACVVAVMTFLVASVAPGLIPSAVPGRNAGFLVDPNNAGVLIGSLTAYRLARFTGDLSRGSTRRSDALVLGAMTWALISTGSRTAWIACAVSVLVVVVIRRRALGALARRRIVRTVGGLIVVALVALPSLGPQLRSIATRPDTVGRRTEVLQASVESFTSAPFTGRGLFHTLSRGVGFPHNSFLWLAGDAGLVGLVAVGIVALVPLAWAVGALRIRPTDPLALPIVAALVTMVVASMGIEAVFQRQWWVFIGAATAWGRTRQRQPTRFDDGGRRPAAASPDPVGEQ